MPFKLEIPSLELRVKVMDHHSFVYSFGAKRIATMSCNRPQNIRFKVREVLPTRMRK